MSKNRFLVPLILAVATMAPAAYAKDKDASGPPDPDKKICKNEKMTGSLTRVTRTCMTAAEWSKIAEATSKSIDDLNRNQARFVPTPADKTPTPGLGF